MNVTDLFLTFFVMGSIVMTVYMIALWNRLSRRRARIVRLQADLSGVATRRYDVRRAVYEHGRRATWHERGIATRRRARRALVTDNATGWPVGGTDVIRLGLATDVNSIDAEARARAQLFAEAEQFNSILASVPTGWIAQLLGFRPWRYEWAVKRRDRRR